MPGGGREGGVEVTRFPFTNIWGHPQPNNGAVSFSEEASEKSLLSSVNGGVEGGGWLSTHPLQC